MGGWGQCGLRGIAFHVFLHGIPELGTSRVPRPLTLLHGGKEVSRGGRKERRKATCSGVQNLLSPALLVLLLLSR